MIDRTRVYGFGRRVGYAQGGGRVNVMGAIFNLNNPAHVVHWHFFQMSVSNVVVIGVMLIVFAIAILLPFPGAARRRGSRS
jgi:hypothetical protein